MEITIHKGEKLCIYAVGIAGWGKGGTIAEALKNFYSATRGYYDQKNVVNDLEHQHIGLYVSNETDGIEIDNFHPKPSAGKWCLHLGDEYNAIRAFGPRE